MRLFITAFLQVFFVSINTVFLANGFYWGVAIAGFTISFIWTFNVGKIAVSTLGAKLIYATGAAVGGLTGLVITKIFIFHN